MAAVDKMEELVNKCTDYKNEADAVDEPYDLLRQLEDTLDAGSVKKTLSSKRKALKTLHSSKYVAPISVIADAKESHTINFYEQATFQCSNTMFSKGRETLGVYMLLLFMVVASMWMLPVYKMPFMVPVEFGSDFIFLNYSIPL